MKTISDRIYEILDLQMEILRVLLKKLQNNDTLDLVGLVSNLDLLLNGCENIETLIQAIVVLDSPSRVQD